MSQPEAGNAALGGLLGGLQVIDLTRNLPGPYCTRVLCDLGATVVKVEPPEGDPGRALSTLFNELNRDKACRRIDFRNAADLDTLRGWVQGADVMVDSFRPGVLESIGLGFERLSALNPRLVMVSITGYGSQGPWARRAGHDLNYMAMSGALDQCRSLAGDPAQCNVQWGDLLGGSAMATIAILAAVIEASRSGRGRHVDVSMTHGLHAHLVMPRATAAMLAPALGHRPGAGEDLLNGGLPCYRLYGTSDGRHLAFAALEFKFWKAACLVLERPDWVERHWQRGEMPGTPGSIALGNDLARLIATRPLAHWSPQFDAADACVTPVLTIEEAVAHELFADAPGRHAWAAA